MHRRRFQLTYWHKLLIGAGVMALLVVIWNFESSIAPITNHYTTPDWAAAVDQRLLAGARHVAPLAHKKWVEDQLKAEAEAAENAQGQPASAPEAYLPAAAGEPRAFAPVYQEQSPVSYRQADDCGRVRVVVHR